MGEIYTNPPQSRNEAILRATIDNTEYNDPPQSRIEDLLLELKEAIEQGGGVAGVSSFNSRTGAVTPAAGDYDAGKITYDNQESDLEATDTQGAIDELTAKKTYKVTGAINGNFAGLNGSGELTDSGKKASDFALADTIALVEPGDTAISRHEVGTYFLNKNGAFCRTTATIAVGETITVGTNCVETSVGSELSKRTFGTPVTISDHTNGIFYTRSSPYTVPTNGYISLIHYTSTGDIQSTLIISDGSLTEIYKKFTVSDLTAMYDSMFITAGMKISVDAGDVSAYPDIKFIPLT